MYFLSGPTNSLIDKLNKTMIGTDIFSTKLILLCIIRNKSETMTSINL